MDTHIQGPIHDSTQGGGAVPSQRGYAFTYKDTSKILCTVLASIEEPVLVELWADILTAFNAGTDNQIEVATDAGEGIVLIGEADVDEQVASLQAYRAILFRTNGNIAVTYNYTGTPPTAGDGIIIIRAAGIHL